MTVRGDVTTGAAAPTAPSPTWVKPLAAAYTIEQAFGVNGHPGIDLGVPVGTPVLAARAGRVDFAADDGGGYGNLVRIDHDGGFQTRYGHLSKIDATKGATVRAGDLIGLSGGAKGAPGAGNSTGPHLHFEIQLNGVPVDPAPILNGAQTLAAGGTIGGSASSSTSGGVSAIGDLLDALTTWELWRRVGIGLVGCALIWVGARIVEPDLFDSLVDGLKP